MESARYRFLDECYRRRITVGVDSSANLDVSLRGCKHASGKFSVSVPSEALGLMFLITCVACFFSPLRRSVYTVCRVVRLEVHGCPVGGFKRVRSFDEGEGLPLGIGVFHVVGRVMPHFFFSFLRYFFGDRVLGARFRDHVLEVGNLDVQGPGKRRRGRGGRPRGRESFAGYPWGDVFSSVFLIMVAWVRGFGV